MQRRNCLSLRYLQNPASPPHRGGAGYSATEGTENMTHDGAYMTL